jgi:glutamate/tyrosine decarboxylase-like PLP-dependent enzyme
VDLSGWLQRAVEGNATWADEFGSFESHPSMEVSEAAFGAAFDELQTRLKDNYPFFHPRYAGQMLKPPHPAAVAGYVAAMLVNPNNHALDGGPATARMEREVVAQLATMFGFGADQSDGPGHLGHLTTSGTIANLEALYVARSLHPDRGVAYSQEAHYTHGRMCGLLGMEGHAVPVDAAGRIDLDALDELLAVGQVGTVVLTAGTTALGAIEPLHEGLVIARRHGVRVHVDAAYGGFFTLLAGLDDRAGLDPAPWRAIAGCDSVVVDPHKHGLQPYGCGAVLFADPSVGRFYQHDSPYTYFTSDELHLGEISLECSRAGAAAAALWLTFRLLPPTPEGLGRVLAAGRQAALDWAELIGESADLTLYQPPELDIVSYFPTTDPLALSRIDATSARVLADGMAAADDPIYLSTLHVTRDAMATRHPDVTGDSDGARILRSVLMKPESQSYVPHLHERVTQLVRG